MNILRSIIGGFLLLSSLLGLIGTEITVQLEHIEIEWFSNPFWVRIILLGLFIVGLDLYIRSVIMGERNEKDGINSTYKR